ncbi:MAG: hypothetical protein OHK93_007727 [Ramalina farinacea]|uniref:Uncharacterized protein n=1 Tax=Ramalina farinacea TaxID=258253 RepID=A0AA43QM84_9LECA|nr:hypothetical protein [Ramalina farinacea]
MLSFHTFGLLLAFTRISLSFAEEERGWLQKRIQYAAPSGGWDQPNLYTGITWCSYAGQSGCATAGAPSASPAANADAGANANGNANANPPVEEKYVVQSTPASTTPANAPTTPTSTPSAASTPTSTSSAAPAETSGGGNSGGSGGGGGGGSSWTSSGSCPQGCSMTISFTDDSLSVNYAAGNGGSPSTGKTQGTCICMSAGSVRVNIGTTDTADHTTLIEGSAAGDDSYYDVSYVEGYTHPVVCRVSDGSSMSGHHEDLFAKGASCDTTTTKDGTKLCINPGYTAMTTPGADPNSCWRCTLPSEFFAPASGAAYTYPFDDSPCASGPMATKGAYKSPMGKGEALVCCVGPNCSPNTYSVGGQTSMGNCNRPGCMPCQGSGSVCTSACSTGSKRGLEEVFQKAEPVQKRHLRHSHHRAHGHAHA